MECLGRAFSSQNDDDGSPGLCPCASFSFLVNACMGMGFLALPYTSFRLGPVVALCLTLLLGVMSLLNALWVATSLSLVGALYRKGGGDAEGAEEIRANQPVLGAAIDEPSKSDGGPFAVGGNLNLSYVGIIELLYGRWAQRAAMVILALCLAGAMWAYAALVASSFTAMVPLPGLGGVCDVYGEWSQPGCPTKYYAYLLMFAIVAVGLSLIDMKETKCFQIFMTVMRVFLATAIIGDCIRMSLMGEAPPRPAGQDAGGHAATLGASSHSYDPHRFPEVHGLTHMQPQHAPQHLAVAVAALSLHMIIPEAVHDLIDKPRTLLPTVSCSVLFCLVAYCAVGLAVPLVFGEWTRPVCSLNWARYTGGQPEASTWAVIFRSFILLVPCVDVTAAYPIFAVSLSTNLQSTFGCDIKHGVPWYLKLVCAMTPLIGAALEFDVATTIGYTGVLILPFVFLLPPFLLMHAESRCIAHYGKERVHGSPFWGRHCSRMLIWVTFVLGVIVSIVATMNILAPLFAL